MPLVIVISTVAVLGLLYYLIYTVVDNSSWVDVYHVFGGGKEAVALHHELQERGVRCRLCTIATSERTGGQTMTTVRIHRNDIWKAQPMIADMQRRRWS